MAAKVTPERLLRKHLGEEGATAMLSKIDKMVADGVNAAAIEKAIGDDLSLHIENVVVSAVLAKAGLQPIAVKPLQVSVSNAIKISNPVKIGSASAIKINTPIKITPIAVKPTSVGIGPGIKVPGK